ncbi:hypothetical protein QQ054_11100 [Oscillatoria amoena NRMC-F 0135]|nr:hypothetical protein [Oscillatoria laete-virens]MDL5046580.1 hypothetical protein [Oscillatoria amoena NRMC-F 0135]MDL5053570.1 hypothetical protein [Oscillatoria laete-virens NRMC-F 0139]
MKLILLNLLTLMMTVCLGYAGPGHDDKTAAGPNGGKVLDAAAGHVEFFVQEDRKIRITFLDDKMKVIPVGKQVVTAKVEAGAATVPLDFERSGEFLVSQSVLPDGDQYRIVLQIRPDEGGKPQNLRIDYNAHEKDHKH